MGSISISPISRRRSPTTGRDAARKSVPANSAIQPDRRNLPLPDQRAAHFGLTNLRTIQDYIITRRLLTIPGVVQINSWGGTTKQFNVNVDPQKLEAYNVTIPQIISALGNANMNVGGREITSASSRSISAASASSTTAATTI